MIAQYTAVSLVADNRRLAAPASLDGGVTSGLQEDHLSHATPGALKLLKIIDNAETILAIELLAASQAYELQRDSDGRAAQTDAALPQDTRRHSSLPGRSSPGRRHRSASARCSRGPPGSGLESRCCGRRRPR